MIDCALLEARRATLQEHRTAQGRHVLELQQALRTAERSVAQLDGALHELGELLAAAAQAGATNGTSPEEGEESHVHRT